MRAYAVGIAVIILAFGSRPVLAQDTTIPMNLKEAVRMALEENLDLEIERISPEIAREQIRQFEAEFSPLFSISAYYADNTRFVNSILEQTAENGLIHEDIFTPESSLDGKFTTGTEYSLSLSAPRIESD